MPRPPKRTITRDSVFRTSGRVETDQPAQGVARSEPTTRQTGMWLTDDDIAWLEEQCRDIRRAGWRSVTRSAVVRALIQAARDQAIDVAGVAGESELVQRLIAR